MSVHIDWGALGAVFLVSFGAAVGVIVLFALGVSTLTPPTTNPTHHQPHPRPSHPRPSQDSPCTP